MNKKFRTLISFTGILAGSLILIAALEEKVNAHHCGPFDFTGNCLHGGADDPSSGSDIQPIRPRSVIPSGWVKIQNRNWDRCLNLQSARQNGVGVNSWECVSHSDQEWKIKSIGNGYFKIQNRNWDRCLNLQSARQNGVGVNSWECVSHPDQEWKIKPI